MPPVGVFLFFHGTRRAYDSSGEEREGNQGGEGFKGVLTIKHKYISETSMPIASKRAERSPIAREDICAS